MKQKIGGTRSRRASRPSSGLQTGRSTTTSETHIPQTIQLGGGKLISIEVSLHTVQNRWMATTYKKIFHIHREIAVGELDNDTIFKTLLEVLNTELQYGENTLSPVDNIYAKGRVWVDKDNETHRVVKIGVNKLGLGKWLKEVPRPVSGNDAAPPVADHAQNSDGAADRTQNSDVDQAENSGAADHQAQNSGAAAGTPKNCYIRKKVPEPPFQIEMADFFENAKVKPSNGDVVIGRTNRQISIYDKTQNEWKWDDKTMNLLKITSKKTIEDMKTEQDTYQQSTVNMYANKVTTAKANVEEKKNNARRIRKTTEDAQAKQQAAQQAEAQLEYAKTQLKNAEAHLKDAWRRHELYNDFMKWLQDYTDYNYNNLNKYIGKHQFRFFESSNKPNEKLLTRLLNITRTIKTIKKDSKKHWYRSSPKKDSKNDEDDKKKLQETLVQVVQVFPKKRLQELLEDINICIGIRFPLQVTRVKKGVSLLFDGTPRWKQCAFLSRSDNKKKELLLFTSSMLTLDALTQAKNHAAINNINGHILAFKYRFYSSEWFYYPPGYNASK